MCSVCYAQEKKKRERERDENVLDYVLYVAGGD